jgi:hypothetical protein
VRTFFQKFRTDAGVEVEVEYHWEGYICCIDETRHATTNELTTLTDQEAEQYEIWLNENRYFDDHSDYFDDQSDD